MPLTKICNNEFFMHLHKDLVNAKSDVKEEKFAIEVEYMKFSKFVLDKLPLENERVLHLAEGILLEIRKLVDEIKKEIEDV